MARRIRWQLVIATLSILLVTGLLGRLALTTTSVASPLEGGAHIEAVVGSPQLPIPLLNNPLTDPVGRDLIALIFDTLVRIGADGLLEPGLASYELDATGTTYLFRLQRNATWHDGQPVTADDVVFTLRTLQILEEPGEPGVAEAWRSLLVDRLDDYTVRVTLVEPFASFLSFARVPILPAHLLFGLPPDQWASSAFAEQLVGSGPYRLIELNEEHALLEANEAYANGRPYLDRIELRFLAAPAAAQAALSRGTVTAYGERTALGQPGVTSASNLRSNVVPLDDYTVLSFNLRTYPFNDIGFRQALAHGLDKDLLIEEALNSSVVRLDTPILNGSWAAAPELTWYDADPARTATMLSDLGYALNDQGLLTDNDVPVTASLLVDSEPRRIAAANEIARQWAELGLTIEVVELESATLQRRLRTGDFTLALHSWARLGPDPDPYLLWHSSSELNVTGLENREIDILLRRARTEQELAARIADYVTFQQRWIELVPAITLYQPLYRFTTETQLGGSGLDDPDSAVSRQLFGTEDRYRTVIRWYTDSYREIQGDLR
ncbi:peptide ABC transporter substrate-binding protein [Candidatus Chloroploca asiatica]|uniref:ABC transporter substrate-binding protein n=1 Tax=Candidatus Chloroploca asiatica TaxID=1506545 RepID=A0A2H3L078_9CHLR|nr:peptide ABC transporter substrate-binding protein [Candidatus Chloroploca asiatica]PDV99715.1 ABC transporter substrate-binding protein [Candidatus Chloroploca asiatica]